MDKRNGIATMIAKLNFVIISISYGHISITFTLGDLAPKDRLDKMMHVQV